MLPRIINLISIMFSAAKHAREKHVKLKMMCYKTDSWYQCHPL